MEVLSPLWAYSLLLGLLLLADADMPIWRAAGGLIALSGIPNMVQKTRREHGAPLPRYGWWAPFHQLTLAAAGIVLAVFGAIQGWKNVEFAFGLVMAAICAITSFVCLITALQEEKGSERSNT